ncbi:MAG: helicase-associated domain-containing protein [Planctomycetes bacterium]|nr:helicase-associated domain-containing protein [Planctomycetota bacterium]MCB9904028.1 helicase-associated domain-containing protein [Planctomycetota bacterium]
MESTDSEDLDELYRFWAGAANNKRPADDAATRQKIQQLMADPEVIDARISKLGRRLASILDAHLAAPRYELAMSQIVENKQLAYLSSYDLEAALAVLCRHGLLAPSKSKEMQRYGQRGYAVPVDLGDAILRRRRANRRGVFDVFALRGHLDRLYTDPGRTSQTPPSRIRELYKMYSNEAASVARVERLPEGLRELVGKAILQFGGILPKGLFERMETELPHWNGRRWGKILEESLLGTVERLDLTRYGIQHNDETLLVFNEVALAWLKRVAVPGDPDRPHDEAGLGVDLVSNISRFISYIMENNVRFTVRGEIFKTTEKRILQELIPNPGRELQRSEVLDFIYRFCRHEGFIETTGQRTFALTTRGRDWEPKSLEEKQRALLDYALEERSVGGEYFHQARMRRIYLRLLKRVEPEVWYDLMYLPFLTRNTYLSNADDLAVEDYFTARAGDGGTSTPMEDLQRLAWNLVGWVRKRLYLLGIVDLGYDNSGRPVAVKLTRIGAKLLGLTDPGEADGPVLGNLVVTPDFEVVMFPSGDDAELIHDLDRFCTREKVGHLIHFRITEKAVLRALAEGMFQSRILATLERNSRTPVPQNVIYSIRDWGRSAGLMVLDKQRVLRCENGEVMKRFLQDPGARPYINKTLDESGVQLKKNHTPKRLKSLLRELDYLVEVEE